ncbi:uncharacterized protein N0V89_003370 [Didymosphaeria variabile]|uniref:N-acetyltransferase domain-containing protein n=1 Tax=Didymosphaeria variabile TaxID=1932322 RepID=A0A9W8XTV5_9PLEO|nr:uncharacterized protein N0V89_003370 [Didymosphaeria variabile]KAJ4358786.1 hypothetical protein N0V89_003370 [Didymosphaeria variabile]
MPITVSIIADKADLVEISPMVLDAWQQPYNPQLKHFRPTFPTHAEAIAYGTERSVKRLQENDPKLFMLKAVDSDSNEIVGFAQWYVNDKPDPYGERTVATWHPEGSDEREFAERFINGLWDFIGKRVTGPHMDLHSITVHTGHRYRGIGRLLIRWGLDKADELGIETVVSSLVSARGAYEKCGLGCIEMIPPSPSLNVPYPSEKWKELESDHLSGWLMWRPAGHDYVAGVDKAPWVL